MLEGSYLTIFVSCQTFYLKLSEQNDYAKVVQIPEGCHRVVIVCLTIVVRLS